MKRIKKIKTESSAKGGYKTIFFILLIILQFSAFILLNLHLLEVYTWVFRFSLLMTSIACLHALSSNINGQAKATWILFMLVSIGFGYIFYFGSLKKTVRKKHIKNTLFMGEDNNELILNKNATNNEFIMSQCKYLLKSGNFYTYKNSKCKYYASGEELFHSVIDEITNAKKYIFIEYYIIAEGLLFEKIKNILIEKAKSGVEVKIIYDDVGSHRVLKNKTVRMLKSFGIETHAFNRLTPALNIAINFRDHRKIVVIDGKVAFLGGANLADEYVNLGLKRGRWKDVGVRIYGDAAQGVTKLFLEQWNFVNKTKIDYKNYLCNDNGIVMDSVVVPFVTGPHYDHSIAHGVMVNQIAGAMKRIYIMTPYFVPDETIINLIKMKAQSGVDIRIILPGIADKKFVYTVSRNNAEKLIPYGVKLYVKDNLFVHGKVVLSDDSVIIGSINMDLRSLNQQFESALFANDLELIQDVEKDFNNLCNEQNLVSQANLERNRIGFRILAGIFNIISPLM